MPVTGQSLTGSLGNESTVADANVTLTGIALTGSLGTVDAVSVAEVTGQALTGSVGTVDVADVVIGLTGQGMTATLQNVKIGAWSPVVPGVSNSWTEINPGVTNTWAEVDTAA